MESKYKDQEKISTFLEKLSNCLTITFSTEVPFLKTLTFFEIAKHLESRGESVQCLDLDLQFSSMLANIKEKDHGQYLSKLEIVSPPSEDQVLDSVAGLLSRTDIGEGGAIIIDSMNSMQELLKVSPNESVSASANHKAAIILSLFQEQALRHSKLLLLSNIARARPHVREGGEVAWEKEPPGGRMIRLKSDVLLSLTIEQRKVSIEVVSSKKKKNNEGDYGAALSIGEKIAFEPTKWLI